MKGYQDVMGTVLGKGGMWMHRKGLVLWPQGVHSQKTRNWHSEGRVEQKVLCKGKYFTRLRA